MAIDKRITITVERAGKVLLGNADTPRGWCFSDGTHTRCCTFHSGTARECAEFLRGEVEEAGELEACDCDDCREALDADDC